jgi:hypothetical protein
MRGREFWSCRLHMFERVLQPPDGGQRHVWMHCMLAGVQLQRRQHAAGAVRVRARVREQRGWLRRGVRWHRRDVHRLLPWDLLHRRQQPGGELYCRAWEFLCYAELRCWWRALHGGTLLPRRHRGIAAVHGGRGLVLP